MDRKPIFDTVRRIVGRSFTSIEVDELDRAIDVAVTGPAPVPVRRSINAEGLAIVKDSEGLELKAYTCPAGVLTIDEIKDRRIAALEMALGIRPATE